MICFEVEALEKDKWNSMGNKNMNRIICFYLIQI